MSTRSYIGKETGSGITAIYCHWDGYPAWNGEILKNHYNNDKIIDELIAILPISSLRENLNPPEGVEHTFDKPVENVTISYYRDRGEEHWVETFRDEKQYQEEARENWVEYCYLWKGGSWYVAGMLNDGDKIAWTDFRLL